MISEKAIRSIGVIRELDRVSWGTTSFLFLIAYRNLDYSLLEWNSPLFASATSRVIQMLKRAQYMALRVVLGCICSTRTSIFLHYFCAALYGIDWYWNCYIGLPLAPRGCSNHLFFEQEDIKQKKERREIGNPSPRHRQLLRLVLASHLCGNHLHCALATQYTILYDIKTWIIVFITRT